MLNNLKKQSKSQTMWFAYALIIFGTIATNLPLMKNIIPPEYYGLVVTAIGIVVGMLRMTTTKSIEDL